MLQHRRDSNGLSRLDTREQAVVQRARAHDEGQVEVYWSRSRHSQDESNSRGRVLRMGLEGYASLSRFRMYGVRLCRVQVLEDAGVSESVKEGWQARGERRERGRKSKKKGGKAKARRRVRAEVERFI
eukprot:153014-Rhodomonas_salina.1